VLFYPPDLGSGIRIRDKKKVRDPDPGSGIKHPGSATLLRYKIQGFRNIFSVVSTGGGIYGTPGFIGCMRRITIDGQYKMPIDWRGEEISNPEDILVDSCQMHDRYR
jgi:hypothetical protein